MSERWAATEPRPDRVVMVFPVCARPAWTFTQFPKRISPGSLSLGRRPRRLRNRNWRPIPPYSLGTATADPTTCCRRIPNQPRAREPRPHVCARCLRRAGLEGPSGVLGDAGDAGGVRMGRPRTVGEDREHCGGGAGTMLEAFDYQTNASHDAVVLRSGLWGFSYIIKSRYYNWKFVAAVAHVVHDTAL